ncbi:transcription factor of the MADS box [Mortierella sp. AM989]|nr:transcription factor of the MADS box [Mortierella sp. AM989]
MSTKRGQAQVTETSRSNTNADAASDSNDDHIDKKFKMDRGDGEDDDDDDDEDEAPKSGKRAGRRKIKIEYIEDKSRRHITFSKRKSGIMKKAYELSTLTGTQVLLLVVSETGLVYTFTTPKLQPLVTKAEGKNLIQACLHAPDKESTPENNAAADPETPEATSAPEYEDRAEASPPGAKGSSQAQGSPSQTSPQQPPYPPPPQQGGYGSSSAMSVPTYPHPYNHIPFPAQYNYPPNMGVHYQNAANGPPPSYSGSQYWPGPPPPSQQSPNPQQSSSSGAPSKGGRKGEN